MAPGNHDYDAMWSAAGFPPDLAKLKRDPRSIRMVPEDLGMFHIGGLDNFRSAFGAETDFFRDQPWYVSHFAGGANSAQVFSAGGYEFLHLGARDGTGVDGFYRRLGYTEIGRIPGAIRVAADDDRDEILLVCRV